MQVFSVGRCKRSTCVVALLSTLFSMVLVLQAGMMGADVMARPAAASVGTTLPAGLSADRRLEVTGTATPSTLPAGGGRVTFTYTVRNRSTNTLYYRSRGHDSCSPVNVSGLTYTRSGYVLYGGRTATLTCTTTITSTRNTTVTISFVDSYGRYVTARETLRVEVATPTFDGGELWYGESASGTQNRIGLWDPNPAATTVRKPIYAFDQSGYGTSAIAVDPKNPDTVFFTRRYDTTGQGENNYQPSTNLFRLKAGSSPVAVLGSGSNGELPWRSHRLGINAEGEVWSYNYQGTLFSTDANRTQVVNRGTVQPPPGYDWRPDLVRGGDITFDGLGNLWIIAAQNYTPYATYLMTIPASELAVSSPSRPAKVTVVGKMANPGGLSNTYYNGLAFGQDGTLYASSSTSTSSELYTVDRFTGGSAFVNSSPGGGRVGDLGSAALPKPELHITKEAPPIVVAGDELTFTIRVENIGELSATGVTLQDLVPAGTQYVRSSVNGVAVPGSTNPWATARDLTGSRTEFAGVIPPGDTAEVLLTVRVPASHDVNTPVCNQARVTFTGSDAVRPDGILLSSDPNVPEAETPTCVEVTNPQIGVELTADKTDVTSVDFVRYTYRVTPTGNEPMRDVTLTDEQCQPSLLAANEAAETGDLNNDGILDLHETWVYTCVRTLIWAQVRTPGSDASVPVIESVTAQGTGTTSSRRVTDTAQVTVNVHPRPAAFTVQKVAVDAEATSLTTGVARYQIRVTNTGEARGIYGQLLDTPKFGPGLQVTSGTGTRDGSAPVTIPGGGPYTLNQPRVSLAGGATHTYDIALAYTVTDRDAAVKSTSCTSGGLRNRVELVDGPNAGRSSEACHTTPISAIDIATTGVKVTAGDDGSYTATYTVTAKNTGTIAGTYGPLTDTPQFSDALLVTGASWTGATTGNATGSGPFQLSPERTLPAGATETYTVAVTFRVKGEAVPSTCTGAPGTGLYHSVAAPGETGPTANNSACLPPPLFAVKATVDGTAPIGPPAMVGPDGKTYVDYVVTRTNTGDPSLPAPQVTATPQIPTGFALESVTLTPGVSVAPKADSLTRDPSASTVTIPAGTTTLAKGARDSWTMRLGLTVTDEESLDWAELARCDTAASGGAGTRTTVAMLADSDGTGNNVACIPLAPTPVDMTVELLASACDASAPTCPLPGGNFAIYSVDPRTGPGIEPTYTPTAVTGGYSFSFAGVMPGQDYWLVETRAPGEHELLATPVKFTVRLAGLELTPDASAPGAAHITVTGEKKSTITIVAIPEGVLPKAGGLGVLPHAVLGALLLGVAALTARRRSGATSSTNSTRSTEG